MDKLPLSKPKSELTPNDRLIVALDCATVATALTLVQTLGNNVVFYKVGWRLFLQGGLPFIKEIHNLGKQVFLDLKMDDISETIELAVREIAEQGCAGFLTIFGSGATAKAALAGRGNHSYPKLLQVTFLSSLDQQDLNELYGSKVMDLEDYVAYRAEKSLAAGCEGWIASGQTIKLLRGKFGPKPIIVSPGIRPSGLGVDDHKRAMTPSRALNDGADFLVVGRPIHAAVDPLGATMAILEEMNQSL